MSPAYYTSRDITGVIGVINLLSLCACLGTERHLGMRVSRQLHRLKREREGPKRELLGLISIMSNPLIRPSYPL